MLETVIFTGPTLSADQVGLHLGARVLPPAAHGDVLKAALSRPVAIGIIDGVFDRLPSIWHKEILYALSTGIAVYGASSMGALRARELASFGMRGVGEIYEAFARDELEDDDEVAILHADAGDEYRNLSDAMVDIRVTLRHAAQAGVVSSDEASELIAIAKAQHYRDRSLRQLVRDRHPLSEWVAVNHQSQKRLDAEAMLQTIRRDLDEQTPAPVPTWTLQRTQYWEAVHRRVLAESDGPWGHSVQVASDRDDLGQLLDESRLNPDRHRAVEQQALLLLLAAAETQRAGVERSEHLLHSATTEGLLAEGITEHDQLSAWLSERRLVHADMQWIRQGWLDRRYVRRMYEVAIPGAVVAELRASGEAPALLARAAQKREVLSAATTQTEPLASEDLVEWYFCNVLERDPPTHLDAWCKQHGWRDVADLLRALGREWAFRQIG